MEQLSLYWILFIISTEFFSDWGEVHVSVGIWVWRVLSKVQTIKFEENLCKTLHGGLGDLKYVPKIIKHISHDIRQKHDPCLLEILVP